MPYPTVIRRSALLAALTLLVLAPAAARACSMCACGDPSYRLVGEEFFTATPWRVGLDYDHGSKTSAADEPGTHETEFESRVTVSGAWTPIARLRLVGRIPVVNRRLTMDGMSARLAGLADPELLLHLQVTPATSRHWAAVMLGARAPWGENERTSGGERAEEHLQPGTGAASLWAGASGAVRVGTRDHVYASLMGRWNGTNRHGYRYGDVALANFAYQHEVATYLAGVLELNARDARIDRDAGAMADNTGGSVLYVTPRLQWQATQALVLRLGLQIPVAQRLLGDQREHANVVTGLTLAY